MPSLSRDWMKELSTEAKPKPTAMVIYGPPGIGKTSIGAAATKPVFLIDDQEDGVNTLKSSGRLDPTIPVFPAATSWSDVLGQIDSILTGEHDRKTLVIDTGGGLERLCHDHVCQKEFSGKWGDDGFGGFQRGFEVALPDWRGLLNKLDRLRSERSMQIIMLSHSIVKPYKNPEGDDYDRFVVDMHHKTWGVTKKWADMILFANYYVEVDKGKSGRDRAKGKGGQVRFFNTEYHAAYDAKNRHGLPADIPMGDTGKEAWGNLVSAIKQARKEVK